MTNGQDQPGAGRRTPRCPVCRAPTVEAFRPFCSARCKDIDLARWLGGRYVIEGGKTDEDEDGEEGLVGDEFGTAGRPGKGPEGQ